jgi:integrase
VSRHPSPPDSIPGVEIRQRNRRDGTVYYVYRVRWRDPVTGKRLVETLDTPEDALDFQAHLRLARRRGVLAELDQGRETLTDFAAEWWGRYAKHNLSLATLKTYAYTWNRHLLPRVGHLQLRQVTPNVIDQLKTDLHEAGVGAPTIRKAMSLLQAMLRQAVAWDRLRLNPVKQIRKPSAPRKRAVVPLSPDQVEALRAEMPTLADKVLIGLLAYGGPRPEDALALEMRHVGRATLLVEQKNVDGELVAGQKTDRPPRSIELLAPLRQDLAEYMLAIGRRTPKALLFPRPDGKPWRDHDYRNWRRRVFQPAAAAAGLANFEQIVKVVVADGKRRKRVATSYQGIRPYDLRHSFASLLIREGRLSLAEIADQLGNSVATLSEVYAHVIADMKGQPRTSADDAIMQARLKQTEQALSSRPEFKA